MRNRRRRRWLKIILGGVLILYVVFVFGGLWNWAVIAPPLGRIDAGAARRELVDYDGKRVELWVARSKALGDREPLRYVLEFCGNATRAEQIADYVASRWDNYPVEAWVMNNPGAGGSEGSLRLKNIGTAALRVFDELHSRGHGKPIFVEANSLGTNAALCVAARRNVAGCVLHDPVPVKQLILGKYGWWNLWLVAAPVAWQIPSELDAIENAKHVKAPVVFIVAEKDDFVVPKYHRMVIDAFGGEKRIVRLPGGHWDAVSGDAEKELAGDIDWLWSRATTERP